MTVAATELPLVAAICRVPLLCEALSEALDGIADVRSFPARTTETGSLLEVLVPDAVVVDTDEQAAEAAAYAKDTGAPLVHVSLRPPRITVFRDGEWTELEGEQATAEAVRNVLVASLLRRERVS